MELRLFFTEVEMKQFLIDNGYYIFHRWVPVNSGEYKSTQMHQKDVTYAAKDDGPKNSIRYHFEQLIKEKILKL